MVCLFFATLGEGNPDKVSYCERFIELMVDLETQLPTRRFFNTVIIAVMDDAHMVVHSRFSQLAKRDDGQLFTQVSGTLKQRQNGDTSFRCIFLSKNCCKVESRYNAVHYDIILHTGLL